VVVSLQTLLDRSNRNMASGTHKVVRESALEIIRRAYKEGIYVQISEGHRPNGRQNDLYAQGRTKPGNIVTNARGGQSWHNYGVAVDFFLTSNDGSKALWTVNNKWRRAAAIGKSLGFEWGGDWTGFVDYPHLQMTGGLSLADLQAGKRPKLTSKVGNKTPAPSKPSSGGSSSTKWINKNGNWTGSVLKQGHKGKQVKQLQTKLADKYFYPNKGAKNNGIDSYFGADTKDAVQRFQSMNGLAVDGVAGKDTYAKLTGKTASSKPKKKKKKYPLPTGVFSQSKHGKKKLNKVKQIQRALNAAYFKVGTVDGYYGAKTKGAVSRFQKVHLPREVDGVYGKNTRKELDKKVN